MARINTDEVARIVHAVIEDAREGHQLELQVAGERFAGHTTLTEEPLDGRDAECLTCGHLNEAEYMVAALRDLILVTAPGSRTPDSQLGTTDF